MRLSFTRRDALSVRHVERQDADNGLLYNVITKREEKRNCHSIQAVPLSFSTSSSSSSSSSSSAAAAAAAAVAVTAAGAVTGCY